MKKRKMSVVASVLVLSMLISSCSIDTSRLSDGIQDLKNAVLGEDETEATEATEETEAVDETTAESSEETSETSAETEATTLETSTPTPEPTPAYPTVNPEYLSMTAEEICAQMTIEEKAAQMVQGVVYIMNATEMQSHCYGSVLGVPYGGSQDAYTPARWISTLNSYQTRAIRSDAGIPFIYGQDSVHGVNYAAGTVIFPHNINLGAANDPELMYEIGVLTGSDIMHTGMIWNFAPCIAAAQDPRWGRTYESYSSDFDIVASLAVPYIEGLMSEGVVVCPKHFFGDGDAVYGTGENSGGTDRIIDRGDAQLTEDEIAERLAVYQAVIDSGCQTIMLSHTSLNGVKMHENAEYISYLKNEMGFNGVIVSDWDSLQNCSGSTYYENVVLCVNAGCDMLMEPEQYAEAADVIVEAYNNGEISEERINDAVIRILNMKINAGLFEDPYFDNVTPSYDYNSDYAHEIARQAAAESMVVLKNDGPMTIEAGMRVFVTGPAADDTAVLCGGWTYIWDGPTDAQAGYDWVPNCNTILDALEIAAEEIGFEIVTDEAEIDSCDLILLCVGEDTYSEWQGDANNLSITGDYALPGNAEAIALAEDSPVPTLTLIVAGRNVLISNFIDDWASVIMCYLPGSEGGNAIVDVLTGAAEATGTLPMPYYSSEGQIGTGECWLPVGYSAN